jgi:hypothetical protein
MGYPDRMPSGAFATVVIRDLVARMDASVLPRASSWTKCSRLLPAVERPN